MATTATAELPDTASGVLAAARERRAAADRAEAELLQAAVQWAIIHPAETLDDAEVFASRVHVAGADEVGLPLAGPGAPLVREFSVAEFAAAIGVGTETGKHYLGHAVELRYRLPRLWTRVVTGELAAWKARRVAQETIGYGLTVAAAAFVDAHVAPVAHKIRPGQLHRLVAEAIGRFMPAEAERRRRQAAEGRRFDIELDQISFHGTAQVTGELDLADALDLDDAIRSIADQLADLGCGESLDVRRSLAAGELARRQLTLDLQGEAEPVPADTAVPTSPGNRPRRRPVRTTVLHLDLSAAALIGAGTDCHVGRVENTRCPVTADQIRQWCGHPDTQLVIRPVIDLADHVHVDRKRSIRVRPAAVDAHEVPDRIAESVALRDHTCVFPWCTRPARRLRPDQHGCDCDHITPWRDDGSGGATCSCQLAPLCRHHHRIKTHGGWSYQVLEPGTYLWTTPHGYHYLRDHTGTLDVTHARRR